MGSDIDLADSPVAERKFLSTLPAWGATYTAIRPSIFCTISIHAPRVGSDEVRLNGVRCNPLFLSTLPAWGATFAGLDKIPSVSISIHAPRVGSDLFHCL